MRAVTVYRWDYDGNTGYRTRHPIGSVLELRKYERVNNYNDPDCEIGEAYSTFADDRL